MRVIARHAFGVSTRRVCRDARPLAIVLALLVAGGCSSDREPLGPGPDLLGSAIKLVVDVEAGRVTVAPAPSATGATESHGLAPSFALLGQNEIGVTTANFYRSAVGEFTPFRVRVRFDLALTNKLLNADLVPSTFPAPPRGVAEVVAFPFATEPAGFFGLKVRASSDWNGTGAPGSGAPHNFFNDAVCITLTPPGDCFRWEAFGATVAAGTTTSGLRVGFDVDPSVQRFTVYVVVAADVKERPGKGGIAGSVSSPERGALAAITVRAGATGPAILTNAGGFYVLGGLKPGSVDITLEGLPTECHMPAAQTVAIFPGEVTAAHFTVHCSKLPAVSAGGGYTCGLTVAGAAYCWGNNFTGLLGDGTTTDRTSPVAVLGGHRFAAVSAGVASPCGVTTAGAAYCWGSNVYGGLGDGTTTHRKSPVAVLGGISFAAVSADVGHTCGVTPGGGAYCWGRNESGRLGDGTTTDRTSPVAVLGGLTFAAVTTGFHHTCGITTAGAAYCWGSNERRQLGDGTLTYRSSPVAVLGGLRFAAVSAGVFHTCGITTAGAPYCWGDNGGGQLGDGTTTFRTSPVPVLGGLRFAVVSAGRNHTCGVTAAGAAYCWGSNFYGALGDGTDLLPFKTSPVAVIGGLRFAAVSAGGFHTCGVTTVGAAYCWGENDRGGLGDGTTNHRTSPVLVVGFPPTVDAGVATFTIPPLTVPAGTTVFGPFRAPAVVNSVTLKLDIANAVQPLSCGIEWSTDGVAAWRTLVRVDGAETECGLFGAWSPPFTGPNLQVRGLVESPAAFASGGGALMVR